MKFADWVTGSGKVIALEPESVNFASLKWAVQRANLENKVELINAAADNRTGEARLEINPIHPGDHKLATEGVLIKVIRIDDIVRSLNGQQVGLIKIDVQGAESRVIEGASETIQRFHPTMYIEIDDAGLQHFGSSAETLLKILKENGYNFHVITKGVVSPPLTVYEVVRTATQRGYVDVLMLYE